MGKFKIETERLIITEFNESMCESVYLNSLDEDTRRFVPDEVFETIEEASKTVFFLISCYKETSGPFVYPVLLKNGENIGHVQVAAISEGWEIGYHIAKKHTNKGYATEAVNAFLPIIMKRLKINELFGVCADDNYPSCAVMEKCNFVLKHKGTGNYHGRKVCIINQKL